VQKISHLTYSSIDGERKIKRVIAHDRHERRWFQIHLSMAVVMIFVGVKPQKPAKGAAA